MTVMVNQKERLIADEGSTDGGTVIGYPNEKSGRKGHMPTRSSAIISNVPKASSKHTIYVDQPAIS